MVAICNSLPYAASPMGDQTADACSIQRTLDLVGDRWTLLILRDLFRGVRRFGQLQQDLGIARNLLADRLTRLVDAEIVEKVPYRTSPPASSPSWSGVTAGAAMAARRPCSSMPTAGRLSNR